MSNEEKRFLERYNLSPSPSLSGLVEAIYEAFADLEEERPCCNCCGNGDYDVLIREVGRELGISEEWFLQQKDRREREEKEEREQEEERIKNTPPALTLFVSPAGSDENNGSFGAPFQTMNRALKVAVQKREEGFAVNIHCDGVPKGWR